MHFQKIGKVRYIFLKNWYKVGYGKFGIRNGYVFETSMARSRPKFTKYFTY